MQFPYTTIARRSYDSFYGREIFFALFKKSVPANAEPTPKNPRIFSSGDPEVADIPSTRDGVDVGVGVVVTELTPAACPVGVGVGVAPDVEPPPDVGVGVTAPELDPPDCPVGIGVTTFTLTVVGHGVMKAELTFPALLIVVELDEFPVLIPELWPVFPEAELFPVFC